MKNSPSTMSVKDNMQLFADIETVEHPSPQALPCDLMPIDCEMLLHSQSIISCCMQ